MTQQEYSSNIQKLTKMAYHYYVLDDPIATDSQYDELYHQVLNFERQNPTLISPHSPTQRVGDTPLESFSKNSHIERMWSLEDVFNQAEMQEWCERIYKSYPHSHFTCSPKFDGASLNLLYRNGILSECDYKGRWHCRGACNEQC